MVTAQGLTALVQENYSFYTVQYNLLLSVTAPLRHSSNVLRYCLIATSYSTHQLQKQGTNLVHTVQVFISVHREKKNHT